MTEFILQKSSVTMKTSSLCCHWISVLSAVVKQMQEYDLGATDPRSSTTMYWCYESLLGDWEMQHNAFDEVCLQSTYYQRQ